MANSMGAAVVVGRVESSAVMCVAGVGATTGAVAGAGLTTAVVGVAGAGVTTGFVASRAVVGVPLSGVEASISVFCFFAMPALS